MLLLLYGAGLRAGEALRLRCCDVIFDERLLVIWDSKFFKSRLIPIGDYLNRKLNDYYSERKYLPMPVGNRSFRWQPRLHDLRYPNLNKIQTFFKKS